MKWLFLLLSLSSFLSAGPFDNIAPSAPDEIASLNTDLIVDDFVSAMSGQLALTEVDLHIKGAQDLLLKRVYVPPQILGSYTNNNKMDKLYLGKALSQLKTKGWVVLPHLWAGYNLHSPYFQVRDPHGFVLEFKIQGNRGILKTASYGSSNLRLGEPSSAVDMRNIDFRIEGNQVNVTWPDGIKRVYSRQVGRLYRLDAELLPNGKAIRYHYSNQALVRVTSTDASGKYTYASIDRVGDNHYKGSDGQEMKLNYELHEIKGKNKKDHLKATFQIPVMSQSTNPVFCNRAKYNDRTFLTSYDAKAFPISVSYFQEKESPVRIKTFSTPSGSISFSYDTPIAGIKGGSTTVSYPNGAVSIYRFNASLLLSSLENWHNEKLYNQKVFTYDNKQHIAKIQTLDGLGNTLIEKVYECDEAGNPTIETHIGDFGTFRIIRSFSKNRLTSELREDGIGFEYTYLNDTHLPLSKTTLMDGKPIRRTCYSYDEANNLIEEKEEGQTITTYHLYQKGLHLHRVFMKEERDWDGNLIHNTEYFYDSYGNTAKEDHYGSDGAFAFSIERTFDEKGNLLDETNPLGQKATYNYDSRSRPIKEIPFSRRLTIERSFDEKGRLTLLKEGEHETSYKYNASDKLIEENDYLGLITKYSYHPVHGKPTLIKADPTKQEINYDPFGREVERKDAYGASAKRQLNSYGDPLEIIHPDGGIETFVYASNGLLLEQRDPDGIKKSFSYDPLGRMLSKKVGSYETNYTYDAYHLIEERDSLGISTYFTYNLSGQKTRKERANIVTEYTYDSLGFLESETISGRKKSFQNDPLGRVVLKDIDGILKTAYTYDSAGNIASITNGDPIHFMYDPYGRLVRKIDAEGMETTISYEEYDRSLIKKIVDQRGVETIEKYNAHGLLLEKEIPGFFLEEFSYDKKLRLISQDHLTFTYTPEGYLSSMCEGETRSSFWTYTPGGKVQSKINPDGTVLHYDYDSQGNLIRVGSREFTYDGMGRLIEGTGFKRELDSSGNIILEEFTNGLSIESSYDDWNRPVKRTLPDGSQILYGYEGPYLKTVTRIGRNGSSQYDHSYEQFNEKGLPLLETGLFSTYYSYDKSGRRSFQENPYFSEDIVYDTAGNLIKKGNKEYFYDNASQLISENDRLSLAYDEHYNCIQKNDAQVDIDHLNQRLDCTYDLNGNLIRDGFVYDEFNQLVKTGANHFTYDALGRRLTSGDTSYFYIDTEEIGCFENERIKELKVMGTETPVAIEIDGKAYAPIVDVQNTIRKLIDWETGEIAFQNTCDAFGNGLTEGIPYAYVGQRYDASTGLVYFGKRYYDPTLGRWLTPDPLGSVDHSNLYQYVFNNPFRFQDPNGENVVGFLFGIGQIIAGGAIMASGVALEVASVGSYTFAFGVHEAAGFGLMTSGYVTATYHAQDIKVPNISWKNTNPFKGPVDEGVFTGDAEGNIIPVPEGNWLTGSKDGKWIQEMEPSHKPEGKPTGRRKDGGHNPGPKHPDPRAWKPHGHVPGVSNPDATPWLPIY